MKHLVFFDDQCPLCQRAVAWLLEKDKKKQFGFAPLFGETANRFFTDKREGLRLQETLILVEDYVGEARIWTYARGVWRLFWLLGGAWKLLGWLCFVPILSGDWIYRLIARHRHRLPIKGTRGAGKDQFLP